MKILETFPPNYALLRDIFGEDTSAVYCYGDTIYNPYGREILPDVIAHEEVHMRQQDKRPDEWYNKYILDEDFRYRQEVEAYGTQLDFIYRIGMPAKLRDWALDEYARALHEKYNITKKGYHQIRTDIKEYAKNLRHSQ